MIVCRDKIRQWDGAKNKIDVYCIKARENESHYIACLAVCMGANRGPHKNTQDSLSHMQMKETLSRVEVRNRN